MDEILPNLFRLKIAIPSPLEYLNSYLIRGKGRNILIDTGMNTDEVFEDLCEKLDQAGVQPQDLTDILCTHLHADHVGLVAKLKKVSQARIIFNKIEAGIYQIFVHDFDSYFRDLSALKKANGVPLEIIEEIKTAHPGFREPLSRKDLSNPQLSLQGGEELSLGDYNFHAIWTPGHSPGHICLYEPKRRFLIGGDHILPTITPHVTQEDEGSNPLADYLNSLEIIEKLDLDFVLPGHEESFSNHRERIEELKEHHNHRRVGEIITELRNQWLTAYQVASRISWDIDYPSWDAFPVFQKWLAVSETLAHLRFLEDRNQVIKTKDDEVYFYSAK